MRLIALVLMAVVLGPATVLAAPPAQAPRPPQAPPLVERVEQLEKQNADLKARVTILEQGAVQRAESRTVAPAASVPEFTRICTIDPVTGQQTCRLVRTPRAAPGCGCDPCTCANGECGSPNCPATSISYPPFGAAVGCANGNCGVAGGGCASGSCGSEGGGGRQPIFRINGGPGLFRSIFKGGRRCCGG